MSYCQDPPAGLQLVQDDAALLGLDGIDGLATGEAATKLNHALGQSNLPQTLVALILGEVLRGLPLRPILLLFLLPPPQGLGVHRGIVDNLVIEGLVGGPERRVVYG